MPSAVIDTQILLRAATKNTTLAGKIVRDYLPLYQFVYSVETRNEVEDVLNRSKTRRKFPHLTDQSVQVFLRLFQLSQPVSLDHPIPKILRDPKDDIFLATALAGQADYLVTEDQDLLVIKRYHDTQIVDLPTFWNVLQSLS